MPHPTILCIRHGEHALAHEGIRQNDISCHVALTGATFDRIPRRHAATGNLVPGKSMGAPRKNTPRQNCALFWIVQKDGFTSTGALTAWVRNLCGMRADLEAGSFLMVSLPIDRQGTPR